MTAALLAAGCGARWDDDQRAAVAARHQGGAAAEVDPTTPTGAATGSDATGPAGSPTGDQPTAAGTPTTAGGTSAGPAAAGAKPCAAPSNAPGVNGEKITIGSISSLSGPVPGLGLSSLAGVRAYVAYRNSTGGVCGRQLALKEADDGLDNGRYRAALNDLSSQVIGVAGGLGAGDAGGVDVAESKKIPIVATPVATAFQNVSTVFDINPPFADVHAVIGKYRYLHDQGVRKAALVYTAADQTREEVRDKQKPQMVAAGIKVVHEAELPLSTLSFDSAARGVANSGADYLLLVLDTSQSASFAKSMRDTGYKLKFEEHLLGYSSTFVDLAGAAANGVSTWIRTLPNEDRGTNAEHDTYLAWMARVAPDVPPDTFSADSWAAAKAFVDALEAQPGPITRAAQVAQLKAVRDYDAGGLLGPIQLGAKRNKGCFVAMKVVSGRWTRLTPSRGFLC